MDRNPAIGGCCGEIAVSGVLKSNRSLGRHWFSPFSLGCLQVDTVSINEDRLQDEDETDFASIVTDLVR